MLLKILVSYFIGYIRISIEGYYIERFINFCTNNKIMVWNLKKYNNVKLNLNICKNDFKDVIKIAKKTKCKIKIEKKKGLPFILYKYRKRKIFGILLVLIVSSILFSSNFIWNIEIEKEDGVSFDNIMEDLEENGLKIGQSKSTIDTKEIINKIRLKRTDIAWIGIELKGTNAIVKIVKADEKPNIIDENEYCNIVSDKTGIITKINAQNGIANVKEGDIIKEGTILINGWMEGKYTGIRYVHAKGEIQAKVWHTGNKRIFYNQKVKEETGEEENKYSIKINNFKINLSKKLSKFEIYDTINTEKKFKIFSDFYLPISIEKTTYKQQQEKEIKYNPEEAKQMGIKQIEEELDNQIENKENIVNKNINVYEKDEYVDIYVTYEVLENVGTEEKIVL